MYRIMAFITLCVSAYATITSFALLARIIIGSFTEGTGLFASFIFTITEPVLIPIREKLDRVEFLRDIPVDLSVFVASVIFWLVALVLPGVA